MATSKKKSASSAKAARVVKTTKTTKTAKAMKAAKTATAAKAAAGTQRAAGTETNADMDFVMNEFKTIPSGSGKVVFRIVNAGPNQSARLGVGLFEQVPPGEFRPIDSKEVDNLPQTPAGSSFEFTPRAGVNYVITFSGEMHSLSTANTPLQLELVVDAGSAGTALETFDGPREVAKRFCDVAGRALLKVQS